MPDSAMLSAIDAAFRLLDREIWIVTAADGTRRGGLLATWVSPASLDVERPMLLAALGLNHFTTELILASNALAAHLLRPDQIDLSWNLAHGSGRQRDKLAGVNIEKRTTAAPVLTDCLAWFDCRVGARYNAGDRIFFWADVVEGSVLPGADGTRQVPPTCLRERALMSGLTADQRQLLTADRDADAMLSRPLLDQWKRSQP